MEIPVYVFTGLLDSGKTTFLQEVCKEPDFLEAGTTILIQCEEGETAYEEGFLNKHNIFKIDLENKEDLNQLLWKRCERLFAPAQILIEYNGMWEMEALFQSEMPQDWYLGGIYSTVDATTAELYLTNMRKTFVEPLRYSNLIMFNRCPEDFDRLKFRRNLKALNPQVDIAFERPDGTLFQNDMETLPFDYTQSVISLEDMDYGLWYLDAMEHPERYEKKEISFTARFCASAKPGQHYFIPGRHIMTCCEDDIQFLGYVCYYEGELPYQHGDWIRVKVLFDYRYCSIYGEEGPVFLLRDIHPSQPPAQELVTFS